MCFLLAVHGIHFNACMHEDENDVGDPHGSDLEVPAVLKACIFCFLLMVHDLAEVCGPSQEEQLAASRAAPTRHKDTLKDRHDS